MIRGKTNFGISNFYREETVRLDAKSIRVIEDNKRFLKIDAVITKVGVYEYPDGMAYKAASTLKEASRTAMAAKLTLLDHPTTMVVVDPDQMKGHVEKPYFDNPKLRAWLCFDKSVCPPKYITDVKSGTVDQDVSIGFYFEEDRKGGTWTNPLTGKKQRYDYEMKKILIDHVAVSVPQGRCTFPDCGLGVDVALASTRSGFRIGNDPFGEYENMEDCISKNQDKDNPGAFCAWFHKQITGKYPSEDVLANARALFNKRKKDMETPEEKKAKFEKCVRERLSEDPELTKEQAAALCGADPTAMDPSPPETPDPVKGDKIKKPCGGAKGKDENEAFEACVSKKMEEGMSREDAEEECKTPPVEEEDEESEPTPMETCVATYKEANPESSDEEAETWCRDELEGAHESADALIERSTTLLQLKKDKVAEELRKRSSAARS